MIPATLECPLQRLAFELRLMVIITIQVYFKKPFNFHCIDGRNATGLDFQINIPSKINVPHGRKDQHKRACHHEFVKNVTLLPVSANINLNHEKKLKLSSMIEIPFPNEALS